MLILFSLSDKELFQHHLFYTFTVGEEGILHLSIFGLENKFRVNFKLIPILHYESSEGGSIYIN
jgi:hypothetical protein